MASDHSQNSTPLFRSRRRRRFWRRGGSATETGIGLDSRREGSRRGGSCRRGNKAGAYSDSECSPPTWRHYFTDPNTENKSSTQSQVKKIHGR